MARRKCHPAVAQAAAPGLAIDDELLDPVLERRFHDPRIAIGPVMAIA
jgi:hypothetical protein